MYFGIVIVLGIIFIVGLLVAIFSRADRRGENHTRGPAAGVAAAAVVLIAIVTALFSATTVDARAVGIQTSFGKYDATLDNGFHWTAPWSSVEQFSTQIQPLNLDVPVAFEGGSSGTAVITVRWSIDKNGAEELWKDWKTFDRVRDNLVKSETREQVNFVISSYSPEDARNGANRGKMQTDIVSALTQRLGSRGVNVDSVSVSEIKLGEKAQQALDRIVTANADIDRAKAEQERARIEAETAAIRQQSQTPEALQRYCLEVVNSWDAGKNGQLPATFNCALGEAGQTQVLVGAK